MPDLPLASTVTQDEAAALLRMCGVEPTAASPLGEMLEDVAAPVGALAGEDSASLLQSGWLAGSDPPSLRPDAERAFRVLAAPDSYLHLVLGLLEGPTTTDLFASDERPEEWVRFQLEQSGLWGRVEFFMTNQGLRDRIRRVLDLGPNLLTPRFKVNWSWSRYMVLLGILDTYREACLRSILERGAAPDPSIDVESILRTYKQGLSQSHYYWGVTLGAALSPAQLNLSRAAVESVLAGLHRDGFLKRSAQGDYRLGRALCEFAVSLLLVPSFVGLRRHAAGARQAFPALQAAYIRGANCLWKLVFSFPDGPVSRTDDITVSIEPVTAQAALDHIERLLAGRAEISNPTVQVALDELFGRSAGTGDAVSPVAVESAPEPLADAPSEASTSAPLSLTDSEVEPAAVLTASSSVIGGPTEKLISRLDTSSTQLHAERTCGHCGAVLRGARRYCSGCGRPSGAVAQQQATSSCCSGCGHELAPTARFCTRCGGPARG